MDDRNHKNEINKKYILSHEYKSIMEDTAKLHKETKYKQQKMIVRKLIKKTKMQHYHEALNNARKNPKDTWNHKATIVPGKSKQNKCNFHNPSISASTFNNCFATAGEKTYNDVKQRHQTNGFDMQAKHERTHLRITRKSSLWSPQPVQAPDVILKTFIYYIQFVNTIQVICLQNIYKISFHF